MRRAVGALCTLIVCMQILVGVPIAVCVLFFAVVGSGSINPVAFEVHPGPPSPPLSATVPPPPMAAALVAPPPNVIPHAMPTPQDNAILESRAEQGSPLAGTVLSESIPPEAEQQLFVAAFEKVAAEKAKEPQATLPTAGTEAVTTHKSVAVENHRERATRFAIEHLYLMAETDEEAGEFDRADQWRALARELRGTSACEAPEGLVSPR
jgi:hypothetical protein